MNQRYDQRTLELLKADRAATARRYEAINASDLSGRVMADISLKALDDHIAAYEAGLAAELAADAAHAPSPGAAAAVIAAATEAAVIEAQALEPPTVEPTLDIPTKSKRWKAP